MTVLRFLAIILIFGAASVAWAILGATLEYRTAKLDRKLSAEVDSLWGPSGLKQAAPRLGHGIQPSSSDINVHFEHHNRYKGLLWFSTYTVDFAAVYTYGPKSAGTFVLELPAGVFGFENLRLSLDDVPQTIDDAMVSANVLEVELPADDREHKVSVGYKTYGRDTWDYVVKRGSESGTVMLRNFLLTATTNFTNINYTTSSASPTTPAGKFEKGVKAVWKYEKESTGRGIGIEMPGRENAGPIAARMSFFAPVGLLFFFTVLFAIVVLKKITLHPMHYLFISAGFFAFHILMAYLVDIISIHAAFWICAAVSVFLVITYMRLVAGVKFAVFYVGLAQLIYLIGFSYAFFWTGRTGLTITIGAIVTLFFLMQTTGRLEWDKVFRRQPLPFAKPVEGQKDETKQGG